MVSTGGVLFCWRIPVFVEECVSISRKESSASGVGGHTSLGEGWILISRRGSYFAGGGVDFDREEGVYIIWSRGVTHFCWRIKEGCALMSRRALVHLK